MVDFSSLQMTAPTAPVSGVGLGGRTPHGARGEFTSTVAVTTADRVIMFNIPPRSRIVSGFLKTTDMDSNGAPTLALNVGTVANPTLFFAGSTIAQTGGAVGMFSNGLDFVTTARTAVIITPSANAATFANGTIVLVINYWNEEPA